MTTFKGRYEIEDGYVGKARPQTFEIEDYEIEEDMDDSDLEEYFQECMHEVFHTKVYPYALNMIEFVEWAKELQQQKEQEDEY